VAPAGGIKSKKAAGIRRLLFLPNEIYL